MASSLKSEEAQILLRAHCEGLAKRLGPGAAFRREDVAWAEERLRRIRELLDQVDGPTAEE